MKIKLIGLFIFFIIMPVFIGCSGIKTTLSGFRKQKYVYPDELFYKIFPEDYEEDLVENIDGNIDEKFNFYLNTNHGTPIEMIGWSEK